MGDRPDPAPPRLQVRPDAVVADLDGRITVFDGSADALVLNETATAIWLSLATPRTVSEVVELLGTRYGQDPGAIHDEVAAVVGQLIDRGLVLTT